MLGTYFIMGFALLPVLSYQKASQCHISKLVEIILRKETKVKRELTLLDTSLTLPDASATAVSAITSALMEPKPPVALVLMKLSSTTSRRSVI